MKTFGDASGLGKAAISIKEMAARVGFSRQRFMQLVKAGAMPEPLRDADTGRPYYSEELQAQCAEVRRRNVGINGKVVMFYASRTATSPAGNKRTTTNKKSRVDERFAEIVNGLHGLGLASATSSQVAAAVAELYPHGVAALNSGGVIRDVFLYLRRKNSAENVGSKE